MEDPSCLFQLPVVAGHPQCPLTCGRITLFPASIITLPRGVFLPVKSEQPALKSRVRLQEAPALAGGSVGKGREARRDARERGVPRRNTPGSEQNSWLEVAPHDAAEAWGGGGPLDHSL